MLTCTAHSKSARTTASITALRAMNARSLLSHAVGLAINPNPQCSQSAVQWPPGDVPSSLKPPKLRGPVKKSHFFYLGSESGRRCKFRGNAYLCGVARGIWCPTGEDGLCRPDCHNYSYTFPHTRRARGSARCRSKVAGSSCACSASAVFECMPRTFCDCE